MAFADKQVLQVVSTCTILSWFLHGSIANVSFVIGPVLGVVDVVDPRKSPMRGRQLRCPPAVVDRGKALLAYSVRWSMSAAAGSLSCIRRRRRGMHLAADRWLISTNAHAKRRATVSQSESGACEDIQSISLAVQIKLAEETRPSSGMTLVYVFTSLVFSTLV